MMNVSPESPFESDCGEGLTRPTPPLIGWYLVPRLLALIPFRREDWSG